MTLWARFPLPFTPWSSVIRIIAAIVRETSVDRHATDAADIDDAVGPLSLALYAVEQRDQDYRGDRPGHERRERDALDAETETKEQNRVSADVKDIDDERGDHRHPRVTLGAKERRRSVIERD